MSGLYNPNFSPARAASPQIRSSGDTDRYPSQIHCFILLPTCHQFFFPPSPHPPCDYLLLIFFSQYLSELLAEHQKLGPFMQILPICSRLLNQGLLFFFFSLLQLHSLSPQLYFPIFRSHHPIYACCFLLITSYRTSFVVSFFNFLIYIYIYHHAFSISNFPPLRVGSP